MRQAKGGLPRMIQALPLFESWSVPLTVCPCGRPARDLQRVFGELPPPAPQVARPPLVERYHHYDGSVCEVKDTDGTLRIDRVPA